MEKVNTAEELMIERMAKNGLEIKKRNKGSPYSYRFGGCTWVRGEMTLVGTIDAAIRYATWKMEKAEGIREE